MNFEPNNQANHGPLANVDWDWIAFQYISDELSIDAARQFEIELATNLIAQEALAHAVEISSRIHQGISQLEKTPTFDGAAIASAVYQRTAVDEVKSLQRPSEWGSVDRGARNLRQGTASAKSTRSTVLRWMAMSICVGFVGAAIYALALPQLENEVSKNSHDAELRSLQHWQNNQISQVSLLGRVELEDDRWFLDLATDDPSNEKIPSDLLDHGQLFDAVEDGEFDLDTGLIVALATAVNDDNDSRTNDGGSL